MWPKRSFFLSHAAARKTSVCSECEHVRYNLSLNTICSCGEEGERRGRREDADDRSKLHIGRLIRRKAGWCMEVWVGLRERVRVT